LYNSQNRDRNRQVSLNIVYTPDNGSVDKKELEKYFSTSVLILSEVDREIELIERTK
jgi:hypothetical protein